ncbi:Lsr2 dimerization domain-containing protein [Rhodococcus sp. 1.20]
MTSEKRLGDTFRENLDPADVHAKVDEYAEDQADNSEDCALVERLIQQCVDDLDGMPVAHEVNERIEFSFRGTDYVIDLRPANAEKLKAVLRQYIACAQRIDTQIIDAESRGVEKPLDFGHTEQQLQAVLSWAKIHNYAVSPSGGITKQIIQAFNAAHRRSSFDDRIVSGAGQAPR